MRKNIFPFSFSQTVSLTRVKGRIDRNVVLIGIRIRRRRLIVSIIFGMQLGLFRADYFAKKV